jgi:TP901 family phage tail tape measure protein
LIAEARVLVTPDTTSFRPLLIAQVNAAAKGVTVPVQVVPTTTATTATAALRSVAGQRRVLTEQELAGAAAAKAAAAAEREAAKAAATHARQLGQLSRGAGATALTFTGLRGATLASTGPFLAGAAAVGTLVAALGTSAQFETSLNTFRVTADATADEMERISAVSKQLGSDLTLPGVTANSAADALSQLSRAGLSVEDSINGVRGTLQLATAANIDNQEAVLLTASALNAFKLAGDQAGRVADLLAASSKESQGEITDVGLALQQSAAAAAQAGVSLEDTVALLTELGRAGLRGSDAGTSLRVALLRLINPSKQAQQALDGLGVAVRDQEGNIRPEVFADITDQLSRFTKAQQDATLATIFGQDAFRAASIIGREGAVGLREMRDATQEVGVAAELASARTQGLAGSIENAKNQVGALGLTLGSALNEPAKAVVDTFASLAKNTNTAIGFLSSLGGSADDTAESFADLARRAGEANAEVANAELGSQQIVAANNARELNKALEESQPAALRARDGIEEYRAGLAATADAAQGLTNRIDEAFDRMAHPPQPPTVRAQGPIPIGPTARLDAQAQIASSNDDLRELERVQAIQLANARKAFENSKGNVKQRTALFQAMVQAEANLNSTRRQITAQQEADARQRAADARSAAEEIARQQRAADQAVTDALSSQESRQQNRVALAAQTEQLSDDIAQTRRLKQLYLQQRKEILARVKDVQTRREAVEQVTAKIIQEEGRIKDLLKQQTEAQQQARQDALDQIAENLSLRTQIAETRGDKDAILAALNAEIANQRKRVAAAKKARQGVLKEQLALEQLLKQRRDLNDQITDEANKDAVGGTSLADLFTKAQEIVSGAGNVGFTTTGLQGLRAQPRIQAEVQQRLDIVNDPAAARAARQQQSTDRLIAAIDQLTAAITGNSATGVPLVAGGQNRRGFPQNLTQEQRFFYQRQARQMVEQGLVG